MDLFSYYGGIDPKIKENIVAVDLFAGAGGLSLGLEQAGIKVVGFVECWKPAIETYLSNFPHSRLLGKDITKIKNTEIKKIKKELGEVHLVVGGPPCQGFSSAGKRNQKDPRNNLFIDFVRFVKILRPKYLIMENVYGMHSMKTKFGERITDIVKTHFKSIGYRCEYYLLNAADFGVPQNRKRVFFIGNRIGKPLPTFKPWVSKPHTFRDACGDLEELESGQKSRNDPYHFAINHNPKHILWLKNTPEGHSAHENENPSLRPPSGYKTTYKRIWWDKPAPAVTTCFSSMSSQNNVHPTNTRALTIREAMRLQTFPDWFFFKGSINDIRKQIGNAVPPLLASRIALSIFLKQKPVLKKFIDHLT